MRQQNTLRRSQAITPYGPGAILDHGQQCFVVLDTSSPRNQGWQQGATITLPRLQEDLKRKGLGGRDGFRLPPTADDGRGAAIKVQRFPQWLFCPRCRSMCKWDRRKEIDNEGKIPTCLEQNCIRSSTILVPMRYLAACEAGHLADVNWFRWAHRNGGGTTNCDPGNPRLKFTSKAGQASLQSLRIECAVADCAAYSPLSGLLNEMGLKSIGQNCRGRQPWQPWEDEEPCRETLQALQRSQASVHYPQIESALDIRTGEMTPDERSTAIRKTLDPYLNEMHFGIEALRGRAHLIATRASKELQDDYPGHPAITEAEVLAVMDDMETGEVSGSDQESEGSGDLFADEWLVLTNETPKSFNHHHNWIKVREERIPRNSGLARFIDGIFLIDRLREVRVFAGFHRVTSDKEKPLTHPNLASRAPAWLPAVEVFGEGIFLRFNENTLRDWENEQARTLQDRIGELRERLNDPDEFTRRFSSRNESLARFVLVHTFSHVFIRQLQYECGYSSASLRERLYVYPDKAGLLIYTADADSEGSLGGLVRQGSITRLGSTVQAAMSRGAWCSNDPVCSELPARGPGRTNRAACHACALVSETSCTEMNGLLDRTLLIGSGPVKGNLVGYFQDMV